MFNSRKICDPECLCYVHVTHIKWLFVTKYYVAILRSLTIKQWFCVCDICTTDIRPKINIFSFSCREEHRKHSPHCAFLSLNKSVEKLTVDEFLKLECERQKNKLVSTHDLLCDSGYCQYGNWYITQGCTCSGDLHSRIKL
jgi:hypothetical protein